MAEAPRRMLSSRNYYDFEAYPKETCTSHYFSCTKHSCFCLHSFVHKHGRHGRTRATSLPILKRPRTVSSEKKGIARSLHGSEQNSRTQNGSGACGNSIAESDAESNAESDADSDAKKNAESDAECHAFLGTKFQKLKRTFTVGVPCRQIGWLRCYKRSFRGL